jgi:CDGSH-type Zn-finger protein
MARIVIRKDNSPIEIKVGGESVWICRCGLTDNPPYCSGKHKKTRDEEEGKLYFYDEDGKRYEVKMEKLKEA